MREAGRPRALKNTLTFLGFRGTSLGFLFRSGAIVPKVLSKAFSASFGALIARPDCFYFDFSVAEQMERTQDHTPKRMVENHLTSPLSYPNNWRSKARGLIVPTTGCISMFVAPSRQKPRSKASIF